MMGLKISTTSELEKVEAKEPIHASIRKELGGYIEIVRPRRLTAPYCMIVDEEGLLKGLPINPIGCYLYETDKHMQPIVGDIIIMREVSTFDGISLSSLSDEDINSLENMLGHLVEHFKQYEHEKEVENQ